MTSTATISAAPIPMESSFSSLAFPVPAVVPDAVLQTSSCCVSLLQVDFLRADNLEYWQRLDSIVNYYYTYSNNKINIGAAVYEDYQRVSHGIKNFFQIVPCKMAFE